MDTENDISIKTNSKERSSLQTLKEPRSPLSSVYSYLDALYVSGCDEDLFSNPESTIVRLENTAFDLIFGAQTLKDKRTDTTAKIMALDNPLARLNILEDEREKLTFFNEHPFESPSKPRHYLTWLDEQIDVNRSHNFHTFFVSQQSTQPPTSSLHLCTEKGFKIDFLRIIHAIYLHGFIRDDRNKIPPKKAVFDAFGALLNVDFSTYSQDLSRCKADGTTLETMLRIFDNLKQEAADDISNEKKR